MPVTWWLAYVRLATPQISSVHCYSAMCHTRPKSELLLPEVGEDLIARGIEGGRGLGRARTGRTSANGSPGPQARVPPLDPSVHNPTVVHQTSSAGVVQREWWAQ